MKVIDEKGKLFGKLNIIDLLVIVLLLLVIIVLCVKFLGGIVGGSAGTSEEPPVSDESEEPVAAARLRYVVRVPAQNIMITDGLSEYVDRSAGKRDQLMAGYELVEDGYLVDYWTEPARYTKATDGTVEILDPEESDAAGLVDIYFVIEAETPSVRSNLVVSQEVRIGRVGYTVKTSHFEFTDGVIVSCVWDEFIPEPEPEEAA